MNKLVHQTKQIEKVLKRNTEDISKDSMSLNLLISTAIMHLKKFVDKVLKEESVTRMRLKRAKSRE